MLRGSRVLVTGGTGFIGRELVRRLAPVNQVTVLSARPRLDSSHWKLDPRSLRIIRGDFHEKTVVRDAAKHADLIFHLAGQGRDEPRTLEDARRQMETNVGGTYTVVEAAASSKAQVIFASTTKIYGPPQLTPVTEDACPNPSTFYAASKLAAETLLRALAATAGIRYTVLRLSNVYGPGDYGRVVPTFVGAALDGQPLPLPDPKVQVDLIHVSDVVEAFIAAGNRDSALNQIFNIASGHSISLLHLARIILELSGRDSQQIGVPEREEPSPSVEFDISKARRLLQFTPKITLVEGLRSVIAAEQANLLRFAKPTTAANTHLGDTPLGADV